MAANMAAGGSGGLPSPTGAQPTARSAKGSNPAVHRSRAQRAPGFVWATSPCRRCRCSAKVPSLVPFTATADQSCARDESHGAGPADR